MESTEQSSAGDKTKEWVCRFSLYSTTKALVPGVMNHWKASLYDTSEEEMKQSVMEVVDRCFNHLKNCTMQVDVMKYDELRNTWPIHATYDSHTRTWK